VYVRVPTGCIISYLIYNLNLTYIYLRRPGHRGRSGGLLQQRASRVAGMEKEVAFALEKNYSIHISRYMYTCISI